VRGDRPAQSTVHTSATRDISRLGIGSEWRRYKVTYFNVQLNHQPDGDHVDRVRELWAREIPELDTTPLAVIARLGRVQAYVETGLQTLFSEYGLTRQGWDVVVSLRRIGSPYRLTPTALHQALMRTSGAITHTLHQLEHAGLIERLPHEHDARSLLVGLTAAGKAVVDEVAPRHLANERRMLEPLSSDEQATLATLLRKMLLAFERDQPVPRSLRPSSRFTRPRPAQ
jgi:DNA-binding MarR family transcriptional regulator